MSEASTVQPVSSGAAGTGSDRLRIVFVGRTGLEGRVAHSEGVETVRARTAMEAVGEVASARGGTDGRRTVVIVGDEGEPNGSLGSFLDALRRADPAARVVRVGEGRLGIRGGYDAVLAPDTSESAIRRIVEPGRAAAPELPRVGSGADEPRSRPTGPVAKEVKPVSEPVQPSEPVSESVPSPKPGRSDREESSGAGRAEVAVGGVREPKAVPSQSEAIGDTRLLGLLDASRELLLRAALDLIGERLGVHGVVFIDQNQPDTETAPVPAVPVSVGDKRFGQLRAPGVAIEGLLPHAAWLGSWLGVFDRQQALRRAAFTDPLTGAWNRRYFDGFLEGALDRARAARRTVTVLIFDIDEFKMYNDRYGHPAGDEILIETVRALKSSVRPSDRVCRIGGDEFAVIFDDPDGPREAGSRPPESVYVLAKRVQQRIGEREFPKLGADAHGRLTISGGLAAFPWDGHDSETLLKKADDLAGQSKRQGKNAITLGPGAERVCGHTGDHSPGGTY